jgi:hypothetical protein
VASIERNWTEADDADRIGYTGLLSELFEFMALHDAITISTNLLLAPTLLEVT